MNDLEDMPELAPLSERQAKCLHHWIVQANPPGSRPRFYMACAQCGNKDRDAC